MPFNSSLSYIEVGPENILEEDQGCTGSCDTLDPQQETSRRRKFYYIARLQTIKLIPTRITKLYDREVRSNLNKILTI